jgi:organic hydroperoxide reductase OsmC/OhrA
MEPFPHRYHVKGCGRAAGDVQLSAEGLTTLRSASPAEFDGPGDQWSPETLLVGAVADCFILTFRAVARAANLSWTSLECDVTGQLDRVDRVTQFTRFDIVAHLAVPPGEDAERARRALEKSERACLISSSLKGAMGLDARVEVAASADSREATDSCPTL